jgi:hypothetical protein
LINKKNAEVQIRLPDEVKDSRVQFVDVTTMENPPGELQLVGNTIRLKPFSVAVIKLKG